MNIDENALIISILGTILIWVIFHNNLWNLINFLAENIERQFSKIKELEKDNKIDPLPDGREFDKHFFNVMHNKRDKLSAKSILKLDRIIREEKRREEFEYINSIDYSKKY